MEKAQAAAGDRGARAAAERERKPEGRREGRERDRERPQGARRAWGAPRERAGAPERDRDRPPRTEHGERQPRPPRRDERSAWRRGSGHGGGPGRGQAVGEPGHRGWPGAGQRRHRDGGCRRPRGQGAARGAAPHLRLRLRRRGGRGGLRGPQRQAARHQDAARGEEQAAQRAHRGPAPSRALARCRPRRGEALGEPGHG